jgi:membrane protein implicated in regulation of membrane protease activity
MLKLGYFLMIAAVVLLGGYAVYFIIHAVVTAPGLSPFFKVVILVGITGFFITIVGLILECRREKDDYSDNGDN